MRIWLTQSKWSSDPIAEQLLRKDIFAERCPLLVASPLSVRCPEISSETIVIMSSQNAIWYWCQTLPIPNKVIVMGPASARFAKKFGIDAFYADSEGSEALLDYLKLIGPREVLIATAKQRRGILEQELADFGVQVNVLELYKNSPDSSNLNFIVANCSDSDLVVVASMQAAELLFDKVKPAYWFAISTRIANFLSKNVAFGQVINVGSTIKLADNIYSCYCENK